MASSDSDDDVIATSLFLLTSIVHEKHKLNERGQKRKTWERDWIGNLYYTVFQTKIATLFFGHNFC